MLCTGMLLNSSVGTAFGREPVHRIHRDAVAVRVNQLVVDPVAAALRQFVHVQFARRQHHLAHRAVDLVTIDVDVGKVVVSANLLNLPQRILQRMPVPQANILQRRLVIAGSVASTVVSAGNSRCTKTIQTVCLPRHLDVMQQCRAARGPVRWA